MTDQGRRQTRCECGSCRTGSLLPGHCVCIDGERWHACAAWDREDRRLDEAERVRAARAALLAEIGQMRVVFWCCPEHVGAPHRVEWREGIAYCLTDGCGRTSDDASSQTP